MRVERPRFGRCFQEGALNTHVLARRSVRIDRLRANGSYRKNCPVLGRLIFFHIHKDILTADRDNYSNMFSLIYDRNSDKRLSEIHYYSRGSRSSRVRTCN